MVMQFEYPRNALLDLSPINDAIDFRAKQQQRAKDNAYRDDAFALQKREADRNDEFKRAEMFASRALAVDSLPVGPQRAAAYDRLLKQHPNQADITDDIRDPVNGPKLIAAEFGKFKDDLERRKAEAEIKLREAQAYQANQHGNLYRRAANGGGQLQPEPRPIRGMREDGWGLDNEGKLIYVGAEDGATSNKNDTTSPAIMEPSVQSKVLGSLDTLSPSFSRTHNYFGDYGKTTADVPGIVVDAKGKPSKSATEVYQQQRAIESTPDDARQRLLKAQQTQRIFSELYGKPGPGKAYTQDGKIIELGKKESVQDRKSIALAKEGLKSLDYAEEVLLGAPKEVDENGRVVSRFAPKAGLFERLAGDTWNVPLVGKVGGIGEGGRGFAAAKAAVIDMNFAISGASVSNAEREQFLSIYMPSSLDSAATREWKVDRMRSYFNTALEARKAGASDDEIANLYRGAILDGLKGPQTSQKRNPRAMSDDELLRELNK